jgi:SpoVK/Ycf46/Vps4 family AAA+-type ATPase
MVILQILKQTTRFSEDIDLRIVSSLTNNFTGADLKALVRKAGLGALKASRVRQREIAFYVLVYVRVDHLQVGMCGLTSSIGPITTCQIGMY